MPQIDSLKAGQQTIQVVASCIHPKPKVKVLTPLSILHPIPVPGRHHYENNLIQQFAAIHAKSITLNPDNPNIILTQKSYT
jgi:hypothetical protein